MTAPTGKRPNANHARALRRLAFPPACPANAPLADRAVRWLYPWTVETYPGIQRGMVAVLQQRVTCRPVHHWRLGRVPPSWAARRYADAIETRAQAGLALAQELRDDAAKRDAQPRRVPPIHAMRAEGRRGVGSL